MQVSHTTRAVTRVFDDSNLVSSAGLVPAMKLAEKAGLRRLADRWLSVPTDKGANAGLKITSLVAGMVAGADAIDDMAVLRQGGMRKLFAHLYAPSTLGSFLRAFTFGHVRQLDAIASRFLINLAALSPLIFPETGRELRLLRGPRAQRDPRYPEDGHRRADHPRPAPAPRRLLVPARLDQVDP